LWVSKASFYLNWHIFIRLEKPVLILTGKYFINLHSPKVPARGPPVVFFFFISTDKNILEKLKKSGFFIFKFNRYFFEG